MRYELECTRSNVTPAQFTAYVWQRIKKVGYVDMISRDEIDFKTTKTDRKGDFTMAKRTFTDDQLIMIKAILNQPVDVLKLHVSRGNTKLKFFNTGLPAVTTCGGACAKSAACTGFCYALNSENRYMNVLVANYENLYLYRKDPDRYFEDLADALEKYVAYCQKNDLQPVFRLFESGDMVDVEYGRRLIAFIKAFPAVRFYGYTKQYTLDQFDFIDVLPFYKLDNCNLMLSVIDGVAIPAKYDGLYNLAYTTKLDGADRLLNNGVRHCIGDCNKCQLCVNKGHDVFFIIHGSGNYDYIPEKVREPETRDGLIIPTLYKYENTSDPAFYKTSSRTFQGIRNVYCKKVAMDNSYEARTRHLLTVYQLYKAGKIQIYKNGFTLANR